MGYLLIHTFSLAVEILLLSACFIFGAVFVHKYITASQSYFGVVLLSTRQVESSVFACKRFMVLNMCMQQMWLTKYFFLWSV